MSGSNGLFWSGKSTSHWRPDQTAGKISTRRYSLLTSVGTTELILSFHELLRHQIHAGPAFLQEVGHNGNMEPSHFSNQAKFNTSQHLQLTKTMILEHQWYDAASFSLATPVSKTGTN
jgi:hypothetical protein